MRNRIAAISTPLPLLGGTDCEVCAGGVDTGGLGLVAGCGGCLAVGGVFGLAGMGTVITVPHLIHCPCLPAARSSTLIVAPHDLQAKSIIAICLPSMW